MNTPGLRLAEVLGALSLATDLANGQPAEHGLRIAILASRLAAGESHALRQDAFWTGLLRYLGCNAFAVEESRYAAGNDIGLRATFVKTDMGRPAELVSAVLREVGKGAPPLARARGIATFFSNPAAPLAHANAQCDAAVHCGRKLGMGEGVLGALVQVDERYDGRGLPAGIAGGALAPAIRYVETARVAVVFFAIGGIAAALAETKRRAGGHLDPAVVQRFQDDAAALCRGLDATSVWDEFMASEPGLWALDEDALDPLFEAFALLADLKSGFFTGHSPGVAQLARAAAQGQGRSAGDVGLVGRAALLHDIGRVAVPTGLWDKPGALTPSEWERVRLHSYYTDRVLRQRPALARYADIAGRAHERLDGSGYHRGERVSPTLARLLAAADAYHASLEPRAHRPALVPREARDSLATQAREGRLCREAVDAVLAAAGHEATAGSQRPQVLTGRELEVLRLLVLGGSNKEIARQLGVSPRTVQHHTIHIYGKTGVKSRAGVALWAVQEGVLKP